MHRYSFDIKLVVSDIDGTLLTSGNDLNPLTEEVIRAVINDQRRDFTFSTGRPLPMALPILDYFNLKVPFVYSNGAIYDLKNHRVVFAPLIESHQIKKIAKIAEKFGVGMITHTRTGMYCQVNNKDWELIASFKWMKGRKLDHVKRVENINTDVPEESIRFDIFADVDWLSTIWQEVVESVPDVYAVKMRRSVEISTKGMHKGSALKKLAGLMGIPLKNIMAIGDSLNDIPLLQAAGYGVAMGTAPDELKEVADAVVPSSDENGLVKALEMIS